MYLTIQDFNDFKSINGIEPLSSETKQFLISLENSLDVAGIESSIAQYHQSKAHSTAATGTKYRPQYNKEWGSKKMAGKPDFGDSSVAPAPSSGFSRKPSHGASDPPPEEKWVKYVETVGDFKPTKLVPKEGIDKIINDIRVNLNKMTKKNYETQKDKIFELIESIVQYEETQDPPLATGSTTNLHKIGQFIFDISSSNKFFCELYADLYKELIIKHNTVFKEILDHFISNYKDSIQTFIFCDPNADYEKYCAFVKEGDRKKAITTFIIMLLNREVVDSSVVIEITEFFQRMIRIYIDEENRTNEVDELGEILYILVSLGNEKIQWANDNRWNNVIRGVCEFTGMKIKVHKSLSSRFIFKMKDLYDLL